jgi:hypothetical protein
MPFSKDFDDIYRLGIQEVSKDLSISADRLDDQIFATDMLSKIYAEIENSDIIIADMSRKNPNVFYEVGYADARRKLVILLTNNSKDIPFDMLHRPHIIYSSIGQLKSDLSKKLEWAKSEVAKQQQVPIVATIKEIGGEVERDDFKDVGLVKLRIELYNRTDSTIDKINSIYIYTRSGWSVSYKSAKCTMTKSDMEPFEERHIIRPDFTSIPGDDWIPFEIEMRRDLFNVFDPEGHRSNIYPLDGMIKLSVNVDKGKIHSEHKVKVNIRFNNDLF